MYFEKVEICVEKKSGMYLDDLRNWMRRPDFIGCVAIIFFLVG